MVELIHELSAERVRANLELVCERVAAAGRDPAEVQILAAVKYLPPAQLSALADGGVTLVGENRAQDLRLKSDRLPGRFTWDFIGNLQSRKVKDVVGRVRYIHSVATDSVLGQLARHGSDQTEVLIEVNVAGDAGKSGVASADLAAFIERCPARVVGLMTMPPLAARPEDNRRHFATLGELAGGLGLEHLSMGTSQDYEVAVQEGATIVRLGRILYADAP